MSYCKTCGSKLGSNGACKQCHIERRWIGLSLVALLALLVFALWGASAHAQGNATSICVWSSTPNGGTSCVPVSALNPFPVTQGGNAFTNISTNTNTVVKASPGVVNRLTINTAGSGSTATIYDNTACSGTVIGTYSTTAQGSVEINATASTGICVTTAGAGAANVTVTYQ